MHVAPLACGEANCPPLHSRDAPECVMSKVCGLEPSRISHHFRRFMRDMTTPDTTIMSADLRLKIGLEFERIR